MRPRPALLSQSVRRFFRGDRIAMHSAAPLEPAVPGDARQDFKMPVKRLIRLAR